MPSELIYLDCAATCGQRPAAVREAVAGCLEHVLANPGRSGHRASVEALEIVYEARQRISNFFHVPDASRLAFTLNVTDALNMAIQGLLGHASGGRVLASALEHNAVMRPLRALEAAGGLAVEQVPGDPRTGVIDLERLALALEKPDTRVMILNHASNVTGVIQPLAEVGRLCRARGVPLIADTAQTAGVLDIDVERDAVDILTFTGHKGLLGPPGTGGIHVREGLDLPPFRRGGTGSRSEEEHHPEFYPDRLEAGTPNTPGLAGLAAGVSFLEKTGLAAVRQHELDLTRRFLALIREAPGLQLIGPATAEERVAVVSVVVAGQMASTVAHRLDREHSICVRPGLHCAPAAHRTLGTHPGGTVRFSFGPFTTVAEVETAARALVALAQSSCSST